MFVQRPLARNRPLERPGAWNTRNSRPATSPWTKDGGNTKGYGGISGGHGGDIGGTRGYRRIPWGPGYPGGNLTVPWGILGGIMGPWKYLERILRVSWGARQERRSCDKTSGTSHTHKPTRPTPLSLKKHATQKNTVILTREPDLQGYHHH